MAEAHPARRGRAGTLVVPARRLLPALLLAAALLLSACGDDGGPAGGGATEGPVGLARTPVPELGDLGFVDFVGDPAGEPTRLVAPDDGFLLFYFGYLSCPDICPLTLSELAQARGGLPADLAARTSVGMATFDPARDEGGEIADYMANFFDDGYHALRAEDADTLAEAGERLGATWRRSADSPEEGNAYFMDHSAQVYVIDDEGRAVWEFPYGTDPADITDALVTLDADRT